jgi:uncharacterized protein YkwD
MRRLALACALVLLLLPATAPAGWQLQRVCAGNACVYRWAYVPDAPAVVADPAGFLGWLNAERARRGFSPVTWDAALAADAAANNAQQSARGLGHFYLGSARRQNAGMGALGQVESMWLASPAHAAALFDPSIRLVGLAGAGPYWTYNAR